MNILSLDTSFLSDTSIGLYFSEQEQLELSLKAPLSQEEKLMPAIDAGLKVLNKSIQDIEIIAVGIGPGSFTGLRIGLATAKGLAWSLGIKMAGFSSLELLAESVPQGLVTQSTAVVPMIDARMNKVFTSVFRNQKRITDDLDITPDELAGRLSALDVEKVLFLGDGYEKHSSHFVAISGKELIYLKNSSISGLAICRKVLGVESGPEIWKDPKEILPVYLRLSEAEAQLLHKLQANI